MVFLKYYSIILPVQPMGDTCVIWQLLETPPTVPKQCRRCQSEIIYLITASRHALNGWKPHVTQKSAHIQKKFGACGKILHNNKMFTGRLKYFCRATKCLRGDLRNCREPK